MRCLFWIGLIGTYLSLSSPSQAQQVLPDGTLNTVVRRSGNDFTITNGTAAGSNLFHSFREFSIPTGGSATFDLVNTPNISTLFSRVTGSTASNIDGLLRTINSNRPVSVFLLNPNGILFGDNARLNLSGSFIGSTASSVKFADGTVFSATAPTPLLTISVPIGLQMGTASNSIQVQGSGNDGFFPTQNLGLVGTPGATLALLGNGVNLTGGVVTAPAGRLEVGSVAIGEVALNSTPTGWQLDYSRIQDFADLELTARSSLWMPYPIANPFGGLQVVGRNIRLDRSQIAAVTLGNQPSSDIHVRAQGSLTLEGVDRTALFPSSQITAQVLPGATGTGGNITVQTGRLVLRDGSTIDTFTAGAGPAGSIQVNADSLRFTGGTPYFSPAFGQLISDSGILSSTAASGNAGALRVQARQIDLEEGSKIATVSFPTATGKGGDIHIQSDRIVASGLSPYYSSSGIQALAAGFGAGGNIRIDTGTLLLTNGASAVTFAYRTPGMSSTGFGNAGNFEVTARDRIDVIGVSPFSPTQGSTLGSVTVSSGNGGNVSVTAPRLAIHNGGSVSAGTAAVLGVLGDPGQSNRLGNGGNLSVTVENLELSGANPFINSPSSLGIFTFGNGNAGSARINADQIRIGNGGAIIASTFASGNSGELKINAGEITLSGEFAGIIANAPLVDPVTRALFGLPEFPTGQTARLSIAADQITLSDRATISTAHQGFGSASELAIKTNRLSLDGQAGITATTRTGNGGNATLQVRDLLVLQNQSKISVESAGTGNGGNIDLNATLIVGVNNSDILANAVVGNGGNINLTTQALLGIAPRSQLTAQSDITASSAFGISGTIEVNHIGVSPNAGLVQLPEALDDSRQLTSGCVAQRDGRFVITGRGGVPTNPVAYSSINRPWNDLRAISGSSVPQSTAVPSTAVPLVEATTWQRNAQTGKIELIADQSVRDTAIVTCAPALQQ